MPQIQKPTQNAITQKQHGTYKAVDYSSWSRPYVTRRPEIYACEDGKISTGSNSTMGNYIHLVSNDGKRRHAFGHLSTFKVKPGQSVRRGQLIGIMGYTGYVIPAGVGGTHLHRVYLHIPSGTYYYPPTIDNATFRIFYPETKTVTVTVATLNVRTAPTSTSTKVTTKFKGSTINVVGWVYGQTVDGVRKWYMTSGGSFIWSGGVR